MENSIPKILVIEDEKDMAQLLSRELKKHSFGVEVVMKGQEGLYEAIQSPPELILLDLMLPDINGWEICQALKNHSKTKDIPLIILTALGTEEDRIKGLELGADDYLTKPFSMRELTARIRAFLRRARLQGDLKSRKRIQIGPVSIDLDQYEVTINNLPIQVTPTEFSLLKHLASHPERVFTRDQLITALWGEDRFVEDHNIDVHIYSLRQLLEKDPTKPRFLLTVRGVGYKLKNIKEDI